MSIEHNCDECSKSVDVCLCDKCLDAKIEERVDIAVQNYRNENKV